MAANVESMFYFGQVPWHGLGTEVKEALSSKEALKQAGLDWKVISQPICTKESGIDIEGYSANVRDSDGSVLGIVGDRYKIVQNDEAFAFTDALLGEGARYETAGSLAGGKRIWMIASLDKTNIMGDEVIPYLVFTNSFDGSGAVKVAITPIRVVCQNTLTLALKQAERTWSVKHTSTIGSKISQAKETLFSAEKYMKYLEASSEMLADIKVSKNDITDFLTYAFPISENASERQVNNITDRRNNFYRLYSNKSDITRFRGTAYGLMQAAADFDAHEMPKRRTATNQESKFIITTQGGDASLMSRLSNYDLFKNVTDKIAA